MAVFLALCARTILFGSLGCAADGSAFGEPDWTRDRLAQVSDEAAFEASRHALSQWFRIDDTQSSRRRLVTFYDQSVIQGGTGRIRDDTVGYRNRVRRRGEIRLTPRDGATVVECRVQRERLDTTDARMASRQRSYDESPTDTPIQYEAGVSAEQAQVWTDIGRDRELERQILDVVQARLGGRRPAASRPS
jgi:hypothetical protein